MDEWVDVSKKASCTAQAYTDHNLLAFLLLLPPANLISWPLYQINNAGFASVGEFIDSKLNDQLSMINLHISTIVSLSHLFLPGMVHRRRGRLVTISSMVSYLPAPRASIYAATKAFLTSWMKSLEYEIGLEIDKITRRRQQQGDASEENSASSRSSSLFASSSPNLSTVLVTPGATRTNFSTTAECETSLIFRLPLLSMETKVATAEIVEGIISGRKEIQLVRTRER